MQKGNYVTKEENNQLRVEQKVWFPHGHLYCLKEKKGMQREQRGYLKKKKKVASED